MVVKQCVVHTLEAGPGLETQDFGDVYIVVIVGVDLFCCAWVCFF